MLQKDHGWNVSFKPSLLGFVLSLILLVALFRLAVHHTEEFAPLFLKTLLLSLAIFQVLIQFLFFLHVGLESKPHWHTILFLFMLVLALFVIGGSIWIMQNLNYNLMPSMDSQEMGGMDMNRRSY